MAYVMDAIEWYRQVFKEDPTSWVFAPLAEALYARGNFQDAEAICRRGLESHPYHIRGRVILGLSLNALGRSEDARQHLEMAHTGIEQNMDLYDALAGIYDGEGDQVRAGAMREIYRVLRTSGAVFQMPEGKAGAASPFGKPAGKRDLSLEILDGLLYAMDALELKASEAPEKIFSKDERAGLREFLRTGLSVG